MKTRQLKDRIEVFDEIIQGNCSCGEPVNKVILSSCTTWKNGDRFHYPDDKTASCIFRCKKCHEPIHKTFKAR